MKGKKGDHKPLDPVKDFEEPVQRELIQEEQDENADVPAVKKGYAVASFVKPHLERDKDDKAFIAFELSFPLLEEHEKKNILPARIVEGWKALVKHGLDKVSIPNVPPQVVELALAPDAIAKQTCLKLEFAEIERANVSVLEEKGSGKSKEVIRLTFRAKCELDNESMRFARLHFGHDVWLKLKQVQGDLLEERDAA